MNIAVSRLQIPLGNRKLSRQRRGEDHNLTRYRNPDRPDEKIDRIPGMNPEVGKRMAPAAVEPAGDDGGRFTPDRDQREQGGRGVEFGFKEETRKQAPSVGQTDLQSGRGLGKDFLRRDQDGGQPVEIGFPEQAGQGHETEQGGDHQVQQVVAGIDRTESEQQGEYDVKGSGPGQLQTKGTGVAARSDSSTSCLAAAT